MPAALVLRALTLQDPESNGFGEAQMHPWQSQFSPAIRNSEAGTDPGNVDTAVTLWQPKPGGEGCTDEPPSPPVTHAPRLGRQAATRLRRPSRNPVSQGVMPQE